MYIYTVKPIFISCIIYNFLLFVLFSVYFYTKFLSNTPEVQRSLFGSIFIAFFLNKIVGKANTEMYFCLQNKLRPN